MSITRTAEPSHSKKSFVGSIPWLAAAAVLCAAAPDAMAYGFGDNWEFATCSYKSGGKTKSLFYKHVGTDIGAKAGTGVYVASNLYYVTRHEYSDGWRWGVVAKTADGKATYLFLHLDNVPKFKSGEALSGKKIGTIADLSKKGVSSHLHLGYRAAPYDASLTLKGALPPKQCTDGRKNLPSYPEAFKSPSTSVVKFK